MYNAYDVTIIGAGPVGMYASFYAAMRNLKVKIIDALPELGGQLKALYPDKFIYDIPGYKEIKAKDLIKNLHKQMESVQDKLSVVLNERVEYVRYNQEGNVFEICTDFVCHYSKTVLITAGKGAFQPRKLGLDKENEYRNIFYHVDDMSKFYDKKVIIFGGGDSAVDWANMLESVAKEVILVHRRNEFRAHEQSIEKMYNSRVKVLTPYVGKSLQGSNGVVESIVLENVDTKETTTIDIDDVIVLFGYLSSLGPIESWDLALEHS